MSHHPASSLIRRAYRQAAYNDEEQKRAKLLDDDPDLLAIDWSAYPATQLLELGAAIAPAVGVNPAHFAAR